MKNIFILNIYVFLLFISFGCQKDYIEPQNIKYVQNLQGIELLAKKPETNCQSYFYYYNHEKIHLGNIATQRLIIGFRTDYSSEQKNAFIAKYTFFDKIESENNTGSADATVVLLKEGYSCSQIEALIDLLKKSDEVQYATPFFNNDEYSSLGVTNQFIVNLTPKASRIHLDNLVRKTNTKIVDQLTEETFILSADKKASGNALEMANVFSENSKVESSEPDFLYIFNSSYAIKD